MTTRICVAGVSGWTGSAVTKAILAADEFELSGAIARRHAGRDVGELLGLSPCGVVVTNNLGEALNCPADVLVDFTSPETVKQRTLDALARGVRVVIGTSGLTGADYADIERAAHVGKLGVVAAGNFSLTAALAKHFSLLAAKHLPTWEVIDYASAEKPDAPSGTTLELAEALGDVARNTVAVPVENTHGRQEARGATVGGTQVHIRPAAGRRVGIRDAVRPAGRAADDPTRRRRRGRAVCERDAAGGASGDGDHGVGPRLGSAPVRCLTRQVQTASWRSGRQKHHPQTHWRRGGTRSASQEPVPASVVYVFSDDDRAALRRGLAAVLKPGGRLFLGCFSDEEPDEQGPRRVSKKELHDAFAEDWGVESVEPSRYEVRPDLKDLAFSEGGPRAWFVVIQRRTAL